MVHLTVTELNDALNGPLSSQIDITGQTGKIEMWEVE